MSHDEGARVRYVKQDAVAHVTIDRPAVLNALDLRTHEELAAVWDDFEADDALRVAVLTGAGGRAFSVGQDLRNGRGSTRPARPRRRSAAAASLAGRGSPNASS